MLQANHVKVKQLAYEQRGKVTDRQFFTSRLFAGYLADIAAAQTRRYKYERRIHVNTEWDTKQEWLANIGTDNAININCGNPIITKLRDRPSRYEAVMGHFAHELGHALFTDFLIMQTFKTRMMTGNWFPRKPRLKTTKDINNMAEIEEYCQLSPVHGEVVSEVCFQIVNVLEDGFVDEKILARFPGVLGQCLAYRKSLMFDEQRTVSEMIDMEDDKEAFTFQSIVSIMLSYTKFGKIKYGAAPHSDFRIQTVFALLHDLDQCIFSNESRSRYSLANRIFIQQWEYAKEFCEFLREQTEAERAASGGTANAAGLVAKAFGSIGGTTEVGAGNSSPVPDGGGGAEPGKSENAADRENTAAEAAGKGGDEAANPGEDKSKGDGSKAQKVKSEEAGRIPYHKTHKVSMPHGGTITQDNTYSGSGYGSQAADDVKSLLDRIATGTVTKQMEKKRLSELNEIAENISYGDVHSGVGKVVHRMPDVDPSVKYDYDDVAGPLLQISKAMQKTMKDTVENKRRGGKLNGLYLGKRLDPRSLVRNDGRYFYNTTLPNEKSTLSVGLLLDESGSMHGANRATYARAAAIILYDFCTAMHVPIMIYGHSTSGQNVDLYSYAEFDTIDGLDAYRLMDISARGSNRDGAALRFVADQLTKRDEDVKLLILVSDGQPAHSGCAPVKASNLGA